MTASSAVGQGHVALMSPVERVKTPRFEPLPCADTPCDLAQVPWLSFSVPLAIGGMDYCQKSFPIPNSIFPRSSFGMRRGVFYSAQIAHSCEQLRDA